MVGVHAFSEIKFLTRHALMLLPLYRDSAKRWVKVIFVGFGILRHLNGP